MLQLTHNLVSQKKHSNPGPIIILMVTAAW